jgi:amino acid adenylation domain-containing protein
LSLAQRCSAVPAPAPLFSALLNYRHSASDADVSSDAVVAADALVSADAVQVFEGIQSLGGGERTNYPFSLSVDDLGQGFALAAQVQAPLDPDRICGFMSTALESLVEALESEPSTPVRELEILSPLERDQLLVGWNSTEAQYPADLCVHELFERQVGESPGSVAVVYEGEELTYQDLNVRANKLAHHLRGMGVGPDALVGICVQRSLEMVVGLLAVLKAGGAYVPLDPAYPLDRLGYMLKDSAPVVVLTHQGVDETKRTTIASALGAETSLVDLDTDSWSWQNQPETNPAPASIGLTPQHLAYVIYTSGSTGAPKGVMVEHRGVVNLALAQIRAFGVAPDSRILQCASLSFDACVSEIVMTLGHGAALYLAGQGVVLAGEVLVQTINRYGITHVTLTPAVLAALPGDADLEPVHTLIVAGEASTEALIKRWAPTRRYINAYGPTETTVCATLHECGPDLEGIPPIGRPISNTQVYLLDGHGQPVPIGVVGEIHIGGAGVARGYLNRPELTAERFITDPFAGDGDAGLYRTGDLGRYLPDGNIEFMGRHDFQVKIRGFRIELGEIEAALSAHPGVGEAVVLAREDSPGDKRLVAYVVAATGKAIEDGVDVVGAEVLRAHLSVSLPEYMVPAAYVSLSGLPLTANGKLDRSALPAPDGGAFVVRGYEAPQGEVETTLAQIWAEVLHLERVGRGDSFFGLGGHSLLAVKVITLLDRADITVSFADIFNNPTVESLAAHLQQDRSEAGVRGAHQIRATGSQHPLFLIHDYTGLDLYFPVLAAQVDEDIPVHGLPGVPLDEPQLQTVEGMAARLVRIIRTVQPEGAYRIAGWSLGGLVAYEVAAQLMGQDQIVEFLGLLDTRTPAILSLREDQGRGNTLPPAVIEDYTAHEVQQFEARVESHLHAQANYAAKPISIPVHLFAAEERDPEAGDPAMERLLGWDSVLPEQQIQLTPVPGSHHTMMEDPQVGVLGQALSQAIAQAGASQQSGQPEMNNRSYVTIQAGKPRNAPIFCVPGAGDSVVGFFDLALALGDAWPLHGLQPRGSDGVLVPHSTVEAAATAYVREINARHPEGPVHLLGHSFGGWVALEMAHQLRGMSRTVASLTVIDSEAPGDEGVHGCEYASIEVLTKLVQILELSAETSLGIDSSELELLDETRQLQVLHQGMLRVGLMQRGTPVEALRGVVSTFGAALRTSYRPQRLYLGPIRLVLVSDALLDEHADLRQRQNVLQGWRQWAPDVTSMQAPGNHMTVLKSPQAQVLASWWLAGDDAKNNDAKNNDAKNNDAKNNAAKNNA